MVIHKQRIWGKFWNTRFWCILCFLCCQYVVFVFFSSSSLSLVENDILQYFTPGDSLMWPSPKQVDLMHDFLFPTPPESASGEKGLWKPEQWCKTWKVWWAKALCQVGVGREWGVICLSGSAINLSAAYAHNSPRSFQAILFLYLVITDIFAKLEKSFWWGYNDDNPQNL